MTRGKISVGRAWWSRVFPGWAGPEEVDDVAIATLPLSGAGRYNDLQFSGVSNADVAFVAHAATPDTEMWWVPYLHGYHDDDALTTHLWLSLVDPAGKQVTLSGGPDSTEQRRISVRRPIIIPEGWHVRTNLASTTLLTKRVYLEMYYVALPIGEYIAPL